MSTSARGMVIGGSAAMLVSFALGWSSYEGATGDNPFHYPFTGGVAWLVIIAAGVLVLAWSTLDGDAATQRRALVALTAVGALLMLIRVVLGGRDIAMLDGDVATVDRGPGMWVALVAALVALAGATIISTRTTPPSVGA